jgi:hypothetical protein
MQPRKQSFTDPNATPLAGSASGAPTSIFIASENMLDPAAGLTAAGGNGTYRAQSLEATVEEISKEGRNVDKTEEEGDPTSGRRRQCVRARSRALRGESSDSLSQVSSPDNICSRMQPRRLQQQRSSNLDDLSGPLTPSSLVSPLPGSSVPSSPKSLSSRSLRHSDEESYGENSSQAIASSGEEEEDIPKDGEHAAPQLIMPSISMPKRRPFTEKGKGLGRLRILLAGRAGMISLRSGPLVAFRER